jgi:hypothetical protein
VDKQIFCVSIIGQSLNLIFSESIAVFKEYNTAQQSKLKEKYKNYLRLKKKEKKLAALKEGFCPSRMS